MNLFQTIFIKYILFLIIICRAVNSFGQFWMYDAGSPLIDEAMDVSNDGEGNFYTTGYFGGSAIFSNTTTLSTGGVSDIFLMKTNSSGQLVWTVKAGGFGEDRGLSIKTDLSGNSYITGFYYGTATFSSQMLTSSGGLDIFIAKYNSSGILQWVVSAGGSGSDISNALALDSDGNVIITGQFNGTATFGSVAISSQINLQTGLPCNNIFIAKYNSNGVFLWIKQGSSDKDCRGINIATDVTGNIFTVGLLSDTLTFDQTHNNYINNAIYLAKMDSNGNEQWFKKAGGSLFNIAYGIAVDINQDVIITGEASGSLCFFGLTNFFLTSTYTYQAFLAKFNGNTGDLTWAVSDGSHSEVSSHTVRTDNSGDMYITGIFKCKFSEYADTLGQGTFNSIGYNDIFVTKFNSAGQRIWMRNFGGKYEDNIHGMIIFNNRPVLAGSFINALSVPNNNNSATITTNHYPPYFYDPINSNSTFCNDNFYDSFFSMISYGNSDIFLIDAIDLSRQPYDYYCRNGSMTPCDRSFVGCHIQMSSLDYNTGSTNNEACGNTNIFAASNTSGYYSDIYTCGPNFTYHWSNGSANRSISVSASGTYSVTVTTEDGCFQSSDTFEVIIHPLPEKPWISDNYGIGTNSPIPYTIDICADSVVLTGSNTNGNSFQWNGQSIPGDSVISIFYYNNNGTYNFSLTDLFGCISQNFVWVELEQPFLAVSPYLLNVSNTIVNDTIFICENEAVSISAFDTISDPFHTYICNPLIDPHDGQVIWNITPNVSFTQGCNVVNFYPVNSGLYNINYTLIQQNLCDTVVYSANISYYVQISPNPEINLTVIGNLNFCIGDSTLLVACCATNYTWQGPWGVFIQDPYNDSIVVVQPGVYGVTSTETNQFGCSITSSLNVYPNNWSVPNIYMNPSNGLICPGDQVTLITSGGISYEWYGPSGLIPSNLSSVQVTVAGYYFCIVTYPDSCRVSSNTVEVKQYSTPFLIVSPNDLLCQGDSVLLTVATNAGSNFQWQSPLFGNGITQVITNPGTYTCQVTSCGITTMASSTIQESQILINTSADTTICLGDTAFLHVQNLLFGSNLIYSWIPSTGIISGGNTDHPIVKPAVTTTYIVQTQNEYFCEKIDTVVVIINIVEAGITNSQDVLCNGDCNGFAIAFGSGSPPLQYHWSNNSNNFLAIGLCQGNYSVIVTDGIGCKDTATVVINEPTPIITSMQATPTFGCNGNCSGQLISLPSGGISPYTFHWSNYQANDTITSLCIGNYFVTIYDDNNCYTTSYGLITDSTDMLITVHNINAITCYNYCNGSITADVTGSQPPFSFVWNNGQTTQTISNLCAGIYIVSVTDGVNCLRVYYYSLNEPVELNPFITLAHPINCYNDTTSLTVNIPYGFPPYNIQWDDSFYQTSQTIHGILAGTYEVIVSDFNKCIDSVSIIIPNPALLIVDTSVVNASCTNSCNGIINLTISGGTLPYHTLWNDGSVNILRKTLCAGNYITTITDNNGCKMYRQFQIDTLGYAPPVDATADEIIIYRGRSTYLHANGLTNATYIWSPSQFLSNQYSEDTETMPLNTTLFQVWTTDSTGCRSTDTITIFINDVFCREPFIYVPNAFTPNGDGNNDILYVYTNMADELYFVIFNRWGEKIFETTSYHYGWDGTYKERNLDPAVFVYYLKAICLNGEIFEKKGNVTLIK